MDSKDLITTSAIWPKSCPFFSACLFAIPRQSSDLQIFIKILPLMESRLMSISFMVDRLYSFMLLYHIQACIRYPGLCSMADLWAKSHSTVIDCLWDPFFFNVDICLFSECCKAIWKCKLCLFVNRIQQEFPIQLSWWTWCIFSASNSEFEHRVYQVVV